MNKRVLLALLLVFNFSQSYSQSSFMGTVGRFFDQMYGQGLESDAESEAAGSAMGSIAPVVLQESLQGQGVLDHSSCNGSDDRASVQLGRISPASSEQEGLRSEEDEESAEAGVAEESTTGPCSECEFYSTGRCKRHNKESLYCVKAGAGYCSRIAGDGAECGKFLRADQSCDCQDVALVESDKA